jgi:Mce-associated membrane protein
MVKNAPRRPSRTTTPRPRKIAGRDDAAAEPTPPVSLSKQAPPKPAPPAPPTPPRRPVAKDPAPADGKDGPASTGAGVTSTLLALLGLLVLMLVVQCAWFVWDNVRDVKVVTSSASTGSGSDDNDPITVPSGRPVVLNERAVQEGVDAAAADAQVLFARNWKSYDKGVDDAVELMTEDFAKQYRSTTDDVRDEFIAKKTEVEVRVVAQSVVRANDAELEALIFLNQYVFRGEGKDAKSTYTPYRALLTMVHTDEGWLVDGIDTK